MRILRKLFFYLIAVPILVLYFLITLSSWRIMNSDFRITHLNIVLWEDMLPVNITVQVRYFEKSGVFTKACQFKTKEWEQYSFRPDPNNPNVYWITKVRFRFDGKYWIKYQITDPEIEKQFIELYKTKPFDVLMKEKKQNNGKTPSKSRKK